MCEYDTMFPSRTSPTNSNNKSLLADVTPWRSSNMIPSSLKRRLLDSEDREDRIFNQGDEEDERPKEEVVEWKPLVPSRKKNQLQKNYEDCVANLSDSDLAAVCRLVNSRMKDAQYHNNNDNGDREDGELERVLRLLEVATLKGVAHLEQCPVLSFGEPVSLILERTAKDSCTKRLDALVDKARTIVEVFTSMSTAVEAHETQLHTLMDRYDFFCRESLQDKHAAENMLSAIVKKHEDLATKSARLDREMEECICARGGLSSSATRGGKQHLSLTLDALQSGDPKILQLMQDRKHACEMQKIAMEEFDKRQKELEYRKSMCVMCDMAGNKMDDAVQESRLRGFNNRCKTLEESFEQTRQVVGQLEIALAQFGALQRDRERSAADKLLKLRADLEEHSRLYGEDDEAPTERKDMEGRLEEFEQVVKRSRQVVEQTIQKQQDLWSSDAIPEQVQTYVQQRLLPVLQKMPFQQDIPLSKPTTTAKLVEWSGYDSDDFFETDETSSAGSSSAGGQQQSMSNLLTIPTLPTENFNYVKQEEQVVVNSGGGGSTCVMM